MIQSRLITLLVLALASSFSGAAAQQSNQGTRGTSASANVHSITQQQPDQLMVGGLVGSTVYNQQNEVVGHVEDLLIDKGGEVQAVVVSVAGFLGIGEHAVAVPFREIRFEKSSDTNATSQGTAPTRTGTGTATVSSTTGTNASGSTSSASTGDEWNIHLVIDANRDQLKSMPAFASLRDRNRNTRPSTTGNMPTAADGGNTGIGTRPTGFEAGRSLIEPAEVPPKDVGAYGVVAFTTLPLPRDVDRYRFVCEAWKATLIPQEQLSNTSLSEQMITYWPVLDRHTPEALRADCDYLVKGYALITALHSIRDADRRGGELATRRGPFLIAWSPSVKKGQEDQVVLVVDLSPYDSQESFTAMFKSWRQNISDNPSLWKSRLTVESVLLALRDVLDRYGEVMVDVLFKKS